jgi:pimeloyl-ACP methyl ester carboxylesterase
MPSPTSSVDTGLDIVSGLLDSQANEQGNELNDIAKKLASWAAIIAVPTAITGFYGQNVPFPGIGNLAPTLVIWGERDRYLGPELAEPDHDDVPNQDRVERLPDASHWVHHEAERVTQLLAGFFAPALPGKK